MNMRALAILTVVALLSVPQVHSASGHSEGYIPAAARGAGQFDSFWTTDVWIYHQGASVVHLWFNPTGQDNTDGESVVIELEGAVTHFQDIVDSLFETEGVGSIHYLADGPVTVISRTWTESPNGGGYGQTIPGVPVGQASVAGSGQGGALRVLVDQKAGYRSNLGVVNVSPVSLTATVQFFTADGLDGPDGSSFTVDLEPFEMRQVNDVLNRLPNGELEGLIIRVGVTSSEGAILAYLSEVDNVTNDASYQEAFRFAY